MTIKKVAIYVDDKIWKKFKEEVLRRHGTTRVLSKEVQNLIESYLTSDSMIKFLEKFGATFISSEDVKKDRPKLKISAGDVLREVRDKRAGLSR